MRTTKSISVTMPISMIEETEKLAKKEKRTRSELVREALSYYKKRAQHDSDDLAWIDATIEDAIKNPMSDEEFGVRMKDLMKYGARQAKKLRIKEDDAVKLVHEYRARRRSAS